MSGLKFRLMFGEEGRSWINPQLDQIRPLIHPVRYCEKDCLLVQPELEMQNNNSVAIISATLALASLSVKKRTPSLCYAWHLPLAETYTVHGAAQFCLSP